MIVYITAFFLTLVIQPTFLASTPHKTSTYAWTNTLPSHPSYCSDFIISSPHGHGTPLSSSPFTSLRDILQQLESVKVKITDTELLIRHHESVKSLHVSHAKDHKLEASSVTPRQSREAYAYASSLSLHQLQANLQSLINQSETIEGGHMRTRMRG